MILDIFTCKRKSLLQSGLHYLEIENFTEIHGERERQNNKVPKEITS